jgi:hypothetical protein
MVTEPVRGLPMVELSKADWTKPKVTVVPHE